MELNVTEISSSQSNYWEDVVPPSLPDKRKKKVSFDDILSNMNLVVNQQGVLQYISPATNEREEHVTRDQGMRNETPHANVTPLEKHSYIYNKYFKNYVDPQVATPARRVPKTIEEYRQMLLQDRIEAIRQKQRIEQIKSKKMLFTSPEGGANRNIQATRNSLRKMGFH